MFQFSTSVFSTQVESNLTELRTITKQEVVFQVLVLIYGGHFAEKYGLIDGSIDRLIG